MTNLRRALEDIEEIRQTAAFGMVFRGFAPAVVATTGALALALAVTQALRPSENLFSFFGPWFGLATICVTLIGADMVAWAQRNQSALARTMALNIAEKFVPCGAAGAVIAGVVLRFAPEAAWMLPGIWQILISLGVFACARILPRSTYLIAGWYFLAGSGALILAAQDQTLSPWLMGAPFGVGQILLAAVLWAEFRGAK